VKKSIAIGPSVGCIEEVPRSATIADNFSQFPLVAAEVDGLPRLSRELRAVGNDNSQNSAALNRKLVHSGGRSIFWCYK
jgi:hypothetical protein